MLINQIESIPCTVINAGKGFSTVTFTLPDDQINGFVALLTSLAALFRGLGWKVKTNIDAIHLRNEAKESEREECINKFETFVCETFTEHVKKGVPPRESLSLTVSGVHYLYDFSSYDIIKNVLTKKKLLKKTGFYKTSHKSASLLVK